METFRTRRFEGYTLSHLRRDLISGLIVGVIAIPLAMAFSIASGVKPEYGIYTTIVAGIIISLFGGSRYQIGGPTGAFVPILLGIVMAYGYENLLVAGFMAGILLMLMGIFKLGSLIKFIPRPVTIGFTTGIAVIIFTGQISNFLGLSGVERHERFLDNMWEILEKLGTINPYSVLTALICLTTILIMMKCFPKIPGSLVGLIISATVAALFFPDKVATIGSTYGMIPNALPSIQFPELTWEKIRLMFIPALLIALLGGIESLLSALVADGMTGDRHNSNRELIGQGLANVVTPLFGGIPATGAIARTATNIKNGAASPLSGVIHGLVVLLVLLLFAPYASHIPLASMAPILMVVAWNMSELPRFLYTLRLRTGDSIILVVTFLTTVFVDLMVGVGTGLMLAFVLFTRKMSQISVKTRVLKAGEEPERFGSMASVSRPDTVVFKLDHGISVYCYQLEGVLFFGTAMDLEQKLKELTKDKPKFVLLDLDRVVYMDVTGISYFSEFVHYVERYGGTILLVGLRPQPKELAIRSGLYKMIGARHVFSSTEAALKYLQTEGYESTR